MPLPKFAAVFAVLALTTFQAAAGIEKDDKTISMFGTFESNDFSDTLTIAVSGGYFLTDTLELQGVALVSSSSSGGIETVFSAYGANANLYLPGPNPDFIPYVGGGASLVLLESGTFSETEIGFNGQAGVKQFLTEEISIDYQAQFRTSSSNDSFILSVGFSIFLE